MNELLWALTLLLSLTIVVCSYKYFGKTGLFIWVVLATIISNIQTVKLVNLFGLETALGTILYGSTFLATDILNYKYGEKEARKTIIYGFLAMIIMTIFMTIGMAYIPSTNDFAQEHLVAIFTVNIRITIASLTGFVVSQLIDTKMFQKLQKKYNKLWVSNNVSTIICQAFDTIIFSLITYYGNVKLPVLLEIMLSMYIFKFIIALLDTPFIYLTNKIKKVSND